MNTSYNLKSEAKFGYVLLMILLERSGGTITITDEEIERIDTTGKVVMEYDSAACVYRIRVIKRPIRLTAESTRELT